MNYFGKLSDRINKFREELLTIEPEICVERAVLITDSYEEHLDKPIVLRRALALENILKNMSIYIEPETLIVGNQASSNRSAPIFPEYAIDWVINELDDFEKRDGDRFIISEEKKQILRNIVPFWEKRTLKARGLAAIPAESKIFYDLGIIKAEGNITSGDAHLSVNYYCVLKYGLKEYKKRAEDKLASLELTNYDDLKKSYFYRAIIIVLDAVVEFARRYADEAKKLAGEESDITRRQELLEISRILNKVPYQGAEGFQEAVQSLWILHLVLQIESNGHSLSYGRMDQYLSPYFEMEIKDNKITKEAACDLLTNLWLKTYTINKVRSWSHTRFSAGSPLYQNVTIGGQTPDGKDAVNQLSYLILRSVAQVKLPQPNLTVRYHQGLSDDFMKECIEVVRLGFGMPAFNNDEIIIPSFIKKGVAREDAYNYSAIGCVEVAVPGKWGYRCTGMSFLNFPRSLMIALNDGVDLDSGLRICQGRGHFKEMTSFSQVMRAWDKVIREFVRHSVIIDSCADMVLEKDAPDILCSALVDDCLERGLTIKEGGAVYDFISGLQVGIANLADSLAAIKKCVFEDKLLTTTELWQALISNFVGEEGQRTQDILLNKAPKYGNDNDYVDLLLREAYSSYIDEISKYKNTRFGRGPIGGEYYAGTSSITANVPQGASTPATPDGRNAYTPLVEGCSPAHEMDKNGPTAVFKSVSKLETDKITGGVLLNQKINPQILETEADKVKLLSLLRTFFNRLQGFHVQYNVVSRDTLLDAQKYPEKHRNLIVRVAGYSAFFNVLSKQTQDDIIKRTEQLI